MSTMAPLSRHLIRASRQIHQTRAVVGKYFRSAYTTEAGLENPPSGNRPANGIAGSFSHGVNPSPTPPPKVSSFADAASSTRAGSLNPHRTPSVPAAITLKGQDAEIVVQFNPDAEDPSHHFPLFWLRDHCQCAECTHPQTLQRQIDTYSLPTSPAIASLQQSPEGLQIAWSDPNTHTSFFSWEWLHAHSPLSTSVPSSSSHPRVFLHPNADPATYPSVPFEAIMTTSTGLLDYLDKIRTYGLCFAPGTPPTTEATESLLNRIAFIRPTHYGAFWDFTSIADPVDTAYTTLPLAAHTDTTYFTDPCGLQMFHMLSHTDGTGGESMFVDGFAAAEHLYRVDRDAYAILSSVPVVSHASGDRKAGVIMNNAAHVAGWPVLNHSSSRHHPENLTQVRWNNDDRSPLTRFPDPATMRAWYAAARTWSRILRLPDEYEITLPLRPGNPVVFDNWRVLHGRRAFTGKRRMCGGYVGMDDFLGRWRGVRRELMEQGID